MRGDAQSEYNNLQIPPEVLSYLKSILPMAQTGMGALSGNAGDLSKMMGPGAGYLDTIYNRQQNQGITALQQAAQLAGGTGMGGNANTRAGIPLGNFMSGMGATRAQGMLGLLNQVYSNAGLMANLGMGASGAMAQLPMDYARTRMGLLGSAIGAYGQQSTTTTPTQSNPFAGILGGALAGAGMSGMGNAGASWSGLNGNYIAPAPQVDWGQISSAAMTAPQTVRP